MRTFFLLWMILLVQACSGPRVKVGRGLASVKQGICGRDKRVQDAILAAYKSETWFIYPSKYTTNCQNIETGQLAGIKNLDLKGMDIGRLYPADVEGLSGLEKLNLSNNDLAAFPELESFANLRELDLSFNGLTSSIPASLANLQKLEVLSLSFNQLSGAIPRELGGLANLRHLDLSNNELEGSIPESFGELKNLFWLDLAHNQLRGFIPPVLGELATLLWLDFSHNQLEESVPKALAELGARESRQFTFLPQSQ